MLYYSMAMIRAVAWCRLRGWCHTTHKERLPVDGEQLPRKRRTREQATGCTEVACMDALRVAFGRLIRWHHTLRPTDSTHDSSHQHQRQHTKQKENKSRERERKRLTGNSTSASPPPATDPTRPQPTPHSPPPRKISPFSSSRCRSAAATVLASRCSTVRWTSKRMAGYRVG